MRRVLGYVLLGVGAFLLVLAPLLRWYALPTLLKTPIDQFAESFAPGTGTRFNPATVSEEDNVHMVAHRTLRGDVAASGDKVGVWDESLILEKTDGTLINATTDRVAWDRKTAEAVNCCNENVDGAPTKHKGLSYKFPFHAKKQTYLFFDTTAKKAYPMRYRSSQTIQDLTVYKYVQRVPEKQIGQLEVPGSLVGEPGKPSVIAPRIYSNTRTVWVEPLSGVIVKGQEKQHQVLRDSSGNDAVTLIEVTLTFDQRTQKNQAKLANDARSQAALLGTWIPLAAFFLGIVLLVLGFLALREREEPAPPATPPQRAGTPARTP